MIAAHRPSDLFAFVSCLRQKKCLYSLLNPSTILGAANVAHLCYALFVWSGYRKSDEADYGSALEVTHA
jgi:hypothetical protein